MAEQKNARDFDEGSPRFATPLHRVLVRTPYSSPYNVPTAGG